MTIPDAVPVLLPVSRTHAALTAASTLQAARQEVARLLQNERATYSEILSRAGASEGELNRWLANDVLPSIRKYGGYLVDPSFRPTAASIADDGVGLLMLPILADISERGLAPVEEEDERIAHEATQPHGFDHDAAGDGPVLEI